MSSSIWIAQYNIPLMKNPSIFLMVIDILLRAWCITFALLYPSPSNRIHADL